jgi:hypothetical protein
MFLFARSTTLAAYCALAAWTLFGVSPASAQMAPKESAIITDCADDLKRHCANVAPGASRAVACLIAYEDQIAPRCRLTAYLASGSLGSRLKALQQMAKICSSDIKQYCSTLVPGGGRIYDCISKNKATLTDACRKGLKTLSPL